MRTVEASSPGACAPPAGRILLAFDGSSPAGCVALRPLGGRVCELKRLFVRADYRGGGLGRRLADAVLATATGLGYERVRLDTLPEMARALSRVRASSSAGSGRRDRPASAAGPAGRFRELAPLENLVGPQSGLV